MSQPVVGIDPISLQAIGRFTLKTIVCLIFGALSEGPFLSASAGWLLLHAGIVAAVALINRVQVQKHILSEWDEGLFLGGTAAILFLLHRLL